MEDQGNHRLPERVTEEGFWIPFMKTLADPRLDRRCDRVYMFVPSSRNGERFTWTFLRVFRGKAVAMALAGLLLATGIPALEPAGAAETEALRWTGTVYLGSTRGPIMDRGVFPTLNECREFVEKFAANRGSSAKRVSEQEDAVKFEIQVVGMTGYEAYCQATRPLTNPSGSDGAGR